MIRGIVHAPIGDIGNALAVIDAGRRVYVGASRDGSYLHVIHPRGFQQVDGDGNVVGESYDLVCTCKGGTFHGTCYRLTQAQAFEEPPLSDDLPVWHRAIAPTVAPAPAPLVDAVAKTVIPPRPRDFDAPVGAGESVEASRG